MSTREVLIETRRRIEAPDRWCHGWGPPHGGKGCLLRHMIAVVGSTRGETFEGARSYLATVVLGQPGELLGVWNDTVEHAQILEGLDKAIAECPA